MALRGRARWRRSASGSSRGTKAHTAKVTERSMSGDLGGPVGKEGRPRKEGWGQGVLTIEAHVMVGEDGRAVPFGGAPDHHMQQAVRGLDVMLLQGKQHWAHWAALAPGCGAAWGLLGLWWGPYRPAGGHLILMALSSPQAEQTRGSTPSGRCLVQGQRVLACPGKSANQWGGLPLPRPCCSQPRRVQ